VRVPASTSNLGAGFDCVGVALDRWLRATATLGDGAAAGPRVARAGELAALGDLPTADDLLVRGFAAACAAAGRAVPPSLVIRAESDIPVGRGLGSSAAALAAGALLADTLLDLGLGPGAAAALCADLEGHPDNAAPACLGGAVLGVPAAAHGRPTRPPGATRWTLAPLALHPGVAFALAVPSFGASTAAMRRALPDGRAASVGRARRRPRRRPRPRPRPRRPRAARLGARRRRPPRPLPARPAPGYDAVCAAARAAGAWGATLSGAGSSVLALAPPERAEAVARAMAAAWHASGVSAAAWTPAVAGRPSSAGRRRDRARHRPPRRAARHRRQRREQQRRHLVGRHRPGEQVALPEPAAEREQRRRCASVSTPSATVNMPSESPNATIVRASAAPRPCPATPSTKLLSIFSTSIGKRCR
jgi:homoserine kinase